MALPEDKPSTKQQIAAFIGGAAMMVTGSKAFERGPVAIQDVSKGINHQMWELTVAHEKAFLSAENTAPVEVLSLPDLTEASFAFDHNARLVLAYFDGTTKLKWYDNSINQDVITDFGADIITPRLTHDDKRDMMTSVSDVIFSYVKVTERDADNKPKKAVLACRYQRDRYSVEYLIATGVTGGLIKVGMMANNRLGWQLEGVGAEVVV